MKYKPGDLIVHSNKIYHYRIEELSNSISIGKVSILANKTSEPFMEKDFDVENFDYLIKYLGWVHQPAPKAPNGVLCFKRQVIRE